MANLNRFIYKKKTKKIYKKKKPQYLAYVIYLLTRQPKKPNSGKRRLARIRLKSSKTAFAFISGRNQCVFPAATVLVEPFRRPDIPGLKYKIIRGVLNADPDEKRTNRRSKFGVPKNKL